MIDPTGPTGCTILGCGRPVVALGMCGAHRKRFKRGIPVFVYLAPGPSGRLCVVTFGPNVDPERKRLRRTPELAPLAERFWARVNKNGPVMPGMSTPCWEWTGARNGKGYAVMRRGGRGTNQERASRIAWELQTGSALPSGLDACHHCDNPACVRVEEGGAGHIFPGTHDDNMADMVAKGRHLLNRRGVKGEANPAVKRARVWLSDSDVREMRELRARGTSVSAIARRFCVGQSRASMIVLGRNRSAT